MSVCLCAWVYLCVCVYEHDFLCVHVCDQVCVCVCVREGGNLVLHIQQSSLQCGSVSLLLSQIGNKCYSLLDPPSLHSAPSSKSMFSVICR